MASIQHFFQGKDIAVMAVTPQNVSSLGVLSNGTTVDLKLLGTFDSFMLDFDDGLFEVSATNAFVANYQAGKADFTGTLSALDTNNKTNALIDLYLNGNRIVKIEGMGSYNGVDGKVLSIIGILANMRTGFLEQRNATQFSFRPVGNVPTWAAV